MIAIEMDAALTPLGSAACTTGLHSVAEQGKKVLTLKTPYGDGTVHIFITTMEFMQSLVVLVPRQVSTSSVSWRARVES
jgi:O-acetylhomoserine/O-acetylserine sulfhydrylase-like pyridoxal-dependent enzyme